MLKFNTQKQNIYLCSDNHINHKNICSATTNWKDTSGCRQFDSIDDMNMAVYLPLTKLKKDDVLFILGDFLFGEKNYWGWFDEIECENIYYILGNHCNKDKFYDNLHEKIKWSGDILRCKIDNIPVIMCHYPMLSWEGMEKTIHIHGHSHGTLTYPETFTDRLHGGYSPMIFDSGIDNAFKIYGEYRPFTFQEIMEHVKH